MIVVRNRAWSAMILLLVTAGGAFAQPVQRTNPNDKKEEKQELAPGTAKTKEEAEAAVKAPVAIPVMPTAFVTWCWRIAPAPKKISANVPISSATNFLPSWPTEPPWV